MGSNEVSEKRWGGKKNLRSKPDPTARSSEICYRRKHHNKEGKKKLHQNMWKIGSSTYNIPGDTEELAENAMSSVIPKKSKAKYIKEYVYVFIPGVSAKTFEPGNSVLLQRIFVKFGVQMF
jgi:hypothetical protein